MEEPPEDVKQVFQDASGATGLRVEQSDEVGVPDDDWRCCTGDVSTLLFALRDQSGSGNYWYTVAVDMLTL